MDDDELLAPPNLTGALSGLDRAAIERAFGESLDHILDPASWSTDAGLDEVYRRLHVEIKAAVELEERTLPSLRYLALPRLRERAGAPPGAGVYQVTPGQIEQVHRGLLFTGGVECCDGTRRAHETLPVTISQLGVALVSYQGDRGTWTQRLYRRDLRQSEPDLVGQMLALLDARSRRGALEQDSQRDLLSELGQRGLMTYAERLILTHHAKAPWRLGHGQPAPYELLTGSGSMDFLHAALDLLRRLIEGHRRFIFVPSAPSDLRLLTIGQALRPLEFAIVETMEDAWDRVVSSGHHITGAYHDLASKFVREVGPQVVAGVYRASAAAPAQIFYAHVDHAAEAAVIALADSTLQEHRGFPLLIDLADHVCAANFGGEAFNAAVFSAYAGAGQPLRHLAERQTRYLSS
jgi:hypothetical protein